MDPKKPQSMPPQSAQAEQSQQTRAKLVSEATRILETGGYETLSLRSAAKAAGLSPAAPYRHFEHGAPELLAVVAESGFKDMIAGGTLMKRIADPSEIVGPVLYLASDASSFVTGDDISVSGGMQK